MAKPEEQLNAQIQSLAQTVHSLTVNIRKGVSWLESREQVVTKRDLEEAEARIIKALQSDGGNAAAISKLTGQLTSSTDELKKAAEGAAHGAAN